MQINQVDALLDQFPPLPRYAEGGYSLLGRSPVVDALLADPLYMPTYSEKLSQIIKSHSKDLPLLFTKLQIASGIPTQNFSKDEILDFSLVHPLPKVEGLTELVITKIYHYWHSFKRIHKEVAGVINKLSPTEINWVREHYHRFFFGTDKDKTQYEFFTSESDYPLKFFNLAAKLDLSKLADCSRMLSYIAQDFSDFQDDFKAIHLETPLVWEEDGLKLIVSQKSYAEITEEADFYIDLGGHNTIYNHAGGTGLDRLLALHLDLNGFNTYQGKNHVQGCGFLGVGMLFSCGGNNTYLADSFAQGCGYFGAGSMINLQGNNLFNMNFAGQSFALFGTSLMLNKEGKNQYLAAEGMAQSATSTLGVAHLIEYEGENSFTAGLLGKGGSRSGGIGQGGSSGTRHFPWLNNPSFYGGVSVLFLGEGYNRLQTPWLGQGSAYFLGIGIVIAEGSNDDFEADYDAQGQGLHLAGGIVLKKGQNSHFKGGWGSLGSAGDRSVGMFISLGGKNHYEATDHSIGTSRKLQALGLFADCGGENQYIFKKLCNANIQYPRTPKEWSKALFLDLGPASEFQASDDLKRDFGQSWGIENHSFGMTVDNKSFIKELFSKFHEQPLTFFPFDCERGWIDNIAYKPLEINSEMAQTLAFELLKASYDRRRQIYESLDLMRFNDRKIDYDLSHLMKIPSTLPEDVFNYAVLWALRNKDRVNLLEVKEALKQKTFTSDYAKKMAIILLSTFWSDDLTSIFYDLMLLDSSDEIRYYATLSLAKHYSEKDLPVLKRGLESQVELVRFALAKGLEESQENTALELVRTLFKDESFYVRRAAGITALSLGDREGISVVIETFVYPTLDLDENYGSNLFSQLSVYLDVDFGADKEAWISWWKSQENDGNRV